MAVISPQPGLTRPVSKLPGDAFGATLTFNHIGPGVTVYVGIGLAIAQAFIGEHRPPIVYAMQAITLPEDVTAKSYQVTVQGTIPVSVPTTGLDICALILDAMPTVGVTPPDPYGINDWADDCYQVFGAPEYSELMATYW